MRLPLIRLRRTFSTGKRVTRFSGRFAPLRIVFPCHRDIGLATKGKRLYGQARRLTSPDLHILCRMCTVDNKAPQSNPFTQRIAKNKVPPPGGRWWRQPPKGVHFPRPQGGCKGFRCPRQRHIKLPSEPARSVGRTHRSVRSTRTIEPGRRKAPEPTAEPSTPAHSYNNHICIMKFSYFYYIFPGAILQAGIISPLILR